ncbi:DUF1707 domain-containing protein [Actinoplanes sp. N902-109]|uniref:DUF1707 SHOCT-like domain-containing protein n=1 Tax=Actinoplanes sp. (strain N902-109) TaxID=649831 RepID=UPI00032960B8|nr:DUF1707 domain-containing protein [Actinoplanes sp. N902-109]AGL15999.1 hypothetical protein L083_2489 [Actinoplanes sp. N902-109]
MTDEDTQAGTMRVANADREQVVQVLRAATAAGRLTGAEFETREQAARAAVTYRDLAALTADLPAPAAEPDEESADRMRIDRRFSHIFREGPWVVPRHIDIKLTLGDVKLDFTEAVINHDLVRITVDLGIGGNVTMIVQPGIKVVAEDLDIGMLGEFKVQRYPEEQRETPTFLRVEVLGKVRAGNFVVRPPRTLLDPLTRPGRDD